MKRTKRFLCVILAVLMTASVCGGLLSSAEAQYSFRVPSDGKTNEIAPGAVYTQYTLTSGIYADTTVEASVLEFNSDDYVVMAYTGHVAGGVATLDEYYDMAVADGYEVVGMINGSFFTVATGIMDEYDVVNGVLVCADASNASKFDGMTVLYSDGTLASIPKSELTFTLSFNGIEAKNMLASINKSGGETADGWKNTFYYFDTYSGTMKSDDLSGQILTYESCPGYEIVCKKEKYSNLAIGGTLYATVTEIRENRFGGTVADDEFVLFMRADSPNASMIGDISVGDEVTVAVEDTVAGATDVTKNAISVFENPSWLVRDGENLVAQSSYNNKGYWHNNVYQARWAVFGTKTDGSWVFLTSEGGGSGTGGSVTLQDAAQAMIDLGCTDVIRMDGGGSVGMYVADTGNGNPGYVQSHSRNVVDCIMVVKRSSPALNGDIKKDLQAITDKADALKSAAYQNAYDYANQVLSETTSVSGDYIRAYNGIVAVQKSYAKLEVALEGASAAKKGDYAPTVWNTIETLLTDATELKESNDATLEDIRATADALISAVASTGEYSENAALGKPYMTSAESASNYIDTDGKELTDGGYGNDSSYTASGWAGYLRAETLVITVDLGEELSGLETFNTVAFRNSVDGIEPPQSVKFSVSSDGQTYTELGTVTKDNDFSLTLEETVSARYVKFEVLTAGAWCFVSEVEVIRKELPGEAGDETSDETSGETSEEMSEEMSEEESEEISAEVSDESVPAPTSEPSGESVSSTASERSAVSEEEPRDGNSAVIWITVCVAAVAIVVVALVIKKRQTSK